MPSTLHKITIVIVTFNAGKHINAAIQSVLQQDYEHKQLLIIDGASTDNTIELIKSYKSSIIHIVSEPDNGIYDAMNKSISMVTTEWVLFLGADDKLSPGCLSSLFYNQQHTADLLYGQITINTSGKKQGAPTTFEQLISNNIPHQGIFYKTDILKKMYGYDLQYKILADYDLNLRIFESKEITTKYIDLNISVFNNRGVSNRTIDYAFFKNKLEYFTDVKSLSKKDKRLSKYYFFCGLSLLIKKNYVEGLKNISHTILFGHRKIYYILLFGSFILSKMGIGRKYSVV